MMLRFVTSHLYIINRFCNVYSYWLYYSATYFLESIQ